jgi:octaprenyl-diphosphate synthase
MPSQILASIADLHGAAERAPTHTARRIADVAAFLETDLREVERRIAETSSKGIAPGTASGGKRIRPMLVLLSAAACGSITDVALDLAAVSELVHMATLLHDDVLDDASERRGVPVARRVYGNAVSVLAGDLLLVNSLERAHRADTEGFARLLTTLGRLVGGEIIQLRGRTQVDFTLATYERVVQDKTASLFAWAAGAGARSAGASEAVANTLEKFGTHLGIAFQVIDDLLDYEGDQQTGKALYTDLVEGKLTLPLLYAIEQEPSLMAMVDQVRSGEPELAGEILARVRALNVFGAVKAYAKRETDAALSAVDSLSVSSALAPSVSSALALLRTVAVSLAERLS